MYSCLSINSLLRLNIFVLEIVTKYGYITVTVTLSWWWGTHPKLRQVYVMNYIFPHLLG
jgi:hypothetical protein